MKVKTLLFPGVGVFIFMSLFFNSCVEVVDDLNKAPTVKIVLPADGSMIVEQDVVTVSAVANDSDGYVNTVNFYVDDKKFAEKQEYPYEVLWNTYGLSPGTYQLKAEAVDDAGDAASDEITVMIIEAGTSPTADFEADVTSGTAPLTVKFTDKSVNSPTSWQWDFGDGSTSTEQNPQHVYQQEGTYTVTLTVSNDLGSDTKTREKYILVNAGGFDTFTDPRDGKTYKIVTIGSQTWFAENLNYAAPDSWYYDNDEQYGKIYGRLYTWESASLSCPDGWHLATDDEWKSLEKYLGMSDEDLDKDGMRGTDQGAKLKSPNYWISGTGLNTVGFTALPGGMGNDLGMFFSIEEAGVWWTRTEYADNTEYAWYRVLHYHYTQIERQWGSKDNAYSVRCIKNR